MMYDRGIFNSGGDFGYGFWGSGWSWLIGIGILLIIVAMVYLLVKKQQKTVLGNSAVELLKTKFAQGELTEEEYTRRRNVLKEN